jgi:hypothetical protein
MRFLALTMPLEYYQCNTNAGQDSVMYVVNRLFPQEKYQSKKNGMQQAWLFQVTGTILAPYWSDHEAQGVWGL